MTVAFDAFVESIRTGTATTQSWTHTPTGVPRAIVVTVVMNGSGASTLVTGITYAGVAMNRIARGYDSSSEPGVAEIWFLGENIASGNQTVEATLSSGTANDHQFVSISYTADRDVEIIDAIERHQDTTNPAINVSANGRTALAVMVDFSGQNDPASLTPNQTAVADHDFGTTVAAVQRSTSTFTTNQTLSWTATVEDNGMAAIAFSEIEGLYPTFRAISAQGVLTSPPSSTDVIVQMPPGRQVGDRIIVAIVTQSGTNDVTWPSGWTSIARYFGPTNATLDVRYRDLDGSGTDPGATMTVTLVSAVITTWGHVYAIKAGTFDASVAPAVSASASATNSNPNADTCTPSWGAMNTLWITMAGYAQGQRFVTASPTNYIGVATDRGDSATGVGLASAWRYANTSSEDASAWTISAPQSWAALTLGIKPSTRVSRGHRVYPQILSH